MEILVSVAAKIAEYAVGPIIHGARIVFNPQNIIQETSEKQKQLEELYNQVNDRCQQDKLDGREIIEDVNKWLETTQATITEVEQWLQKSMIKTNTCTCTREWCWAHKQRKNAIQNKEKLGDMIKEGEKLSNNISRVTPATGITLLSGTGFIVFDSVKVTFEKIMDFLRDDQGMIGIHGMGGVGKTSLVKEAYKKAEVEKLFSKVVVAVVSQAPDLHKIQAQLGEQLCLKYSRETEFGRAAELRNRMKLEKTILVFLDDVWSEIDLATIGIPFGDDHKGCKVVLTTRSRTVCSKMGCNVSIHVIPLSLSDSWDLFKSHAGDKLRDPLAHDLKDVARAIAEECGQLPLALVVVASALKDKSKEEWELALRKLKHSKATELEDIGDSVYASIKLSYDFLKAEITKKCFLMCSLFPEDCEIRVEALTRYALGYGLLDEDFDSYESAKEQVIVTIRDLMACNLLIGADSVSGRSKMHDVVRDATLWITSKGEEVFLVPISSHVNWTRDPRLKKATAISLLACPENQHLPSITECSRLKILLMAQRIPLPNVQDTCFNRLKTLQVLDMTGISRLLLELVLPSSLQFLCNLRILYLRRWILKGNMSIIGSLTSLQILSLAGSVIDKFPKEVADLPELEVLDLSALVTHVDIEFEIIGKLFNKVKEIRLPQQQILDLNFNQD